MSQRRDLLVYPLLKTTGRLLLVMTVFMMVFTGTALSEQVTDTRTVVVTGTGTIFKNASENARSHAIAMSLFSAVDMVSTDLLPLDSRVRNFKILNDVIYGNINQFIKEYKVLTQSSTAKRYRTLVQVTVSTALMEQQLAAAGISVSGKDLPVILMLIAEQNLEENPPVYWWGTGFYFSPTTSEGAVTEVLSKNGFLIIKHANALPDFQNEAIAFKPELSNPEALALGALFNADVVVLGNAVSQIAPNTMGADIMSFQGTMIARALKTETGEEIAKTSQTTVAVGADEFEGGREALSMAATLAGGELARQIKAAWQDAEVESTTIELVVAGTGHLSNFVMFRGMLEDLNGVKDLSIRELTANETTLDIDFLGSPRTLAATLMTNTFESFRINIFDITEETLSIELIPR
jgi:hypothetical protein